METKSYLTFAVCLICIYSVPVFLFGSTIVVEGQNDPNVDLTAVQDAVDNYSCVILKGKFDFRTPGSPEKPRLGVVIERDNVTVMGDKSGATIYGGWVFWFLPEAQRRPAIRIKANGVKISNLRFEETGGAIEILESKRRSGGCIQIVNNSIDTKAMGVTVFGHSCPIKIY